VNRHGTDIGTDRFFDGPLAEAGINRPLVTIIRKMILNQRGFVNDNCIASSHRPTPWVAIREMVMIDKSPGMRTIPISAMVRPESQSEAE